MRSPVAELLRNLAEALTSIQVGWYLFGARAAILHGVARLTADVDVTVRLPDAVSTVVLVTSLERQGFEPRVHDAGFLERTRVVPFVHTPTSLPLDIVLAGPGLEDQFLERAAIHVIEDVPVPVASAEDIIVMKVMADRPKDVEDVVAIAAAYGAALDAPYIRNTLRIVEHALGQSDLLPAFDRALERSQRTR